MILSPDLSASGSLFLRRGDGAAGGTLRLLPDGWQASLNPLPDGDGHRDRGGFPTSADALAWAAVQPGVAEDLATVPGAEIHGPGALLPLVPWAGPHARIALLLREPTWRGWCEAAFKTQRAPAIVAWRRSPAGGWTVRGGLRPDVDGRWTVWRVGQRPRGVAGRAGAERALGAHLAQDAESAHQRLHLQRLPTEALDRLEVLRKAPLRPGPAARLSLHGRIQILRGDGALVGTITSREAGRWLVEAAGRPAQTADAPDAALAACVPDPAALPDLRRLGAIPTPTGLMLPLLEGQDGTLLAAPLRARDRWQEIADWETGSAEGIEALLLRDKALLGAARRCADGRIRVLSPDPHGAWPRGRHGGRLAKDPADALRRLAALAADRLDPDAAAAVADTLDVAQDLRRICPRGGR